MTIIIVVDYAIDHSLFSDVCSRERKLGYSPVHCGELVWVITLAGQSAVCDS